MDSGATKHAFNSKEMFVPQSIQPYAGERGEALYVHTGKGQVVIEGVGTVRFYGANGKLVELNSCLFVPRLDVNFMSLSEVTANGGEVHMTGNRLEVWLHNECVIECVRQDGLYSIDDVVPTVS
jgi:hypothetical protein